MRPRRRLDKNFPGIRVADAQGVTLLALTNLYPTATNVAATKRYLRVAPGPYFRWNL